MVRFILAAVFVVLTLILSIPVLILLWAFGFISPHLRDLAARQVTRFFFWGVMKITGVRVTYIGTEKIPRDQGIIYVSNHRGVFDIVAAYNKFPGITGYLAKKELGRIPLFSLWMKFVHCIFVDRQNHTRAAISLQLGAEELKEGISCYVFPEGTRNKGDELSLLPFKGGAFKIAEYSRCPIVPIAISGTREIFETQFPRIRPGHVIVEFCDPIDTTEVKAGEFRAVSDQSEKAILEALKRHHGMTEEAHS